MVWRLLIVHGDWRNRILGGAARSIMLFKRSHSDVVVEIFFTGRSYVFTVPTVRVGLADA